MFNAFNGQVNIAGEKTNYISFGGGTKNLVIIPGVGDGLKTVKGMALPFAMMYRRLAVSFSGIRRFLFFRGVCLRSQVAVNTPRS